MLKALAKLEPQAYALLRVLSGFMFAFHGAQKIFGIHGATPQPFGDIKWLAGIIELLGGICVLLGWNTRLAAFLCSGTMAVAYFKYHWGLRGGWDFFPTVNRGELAALYCVVFFLVACKGSGIFALSRD
jgi:putative oxidoreductase